MTVRGRSLARGLSSGMPTGGLDDVMSSCSTSRCDLPPRPQARARARGRPRPPRQRPPFFKLMLLLDD
jgi:hypothetical protein